MSINTHVTYLLVKDESATPSFGRDFTTPATLAPLTLTIAATISPRLMTGSDIQSTLITMPSSAISTITTDVTSTPTSAVDVEKGSVDFGKIAGITAGGIFGAICLCLVFYWLYAQSRGIKVCNCFSSFTCFGRWSQTEEAEKPKVDNSSH
ncbi:hypothetical protein P153DRAFT_358431 [Dothidotthia symphoricarpi CBS 119687]|uniref:Uncharacterized protein n=1 Tax=Dothidotthia symphoricarpi CBS 119687 TaxID=1392245 RepID=A0A6A6A7L7_9PLEO|nr:uncharacterized protein P153DRAFT_358431 [Dothidotthia symphoricarpi CBS 119687]KAF2127556.1 hypothetical protein P153DRAFT_358431 [Dothidotthia symphoricarpi CBS 119687]